MRRHYAIVNFREVLYKYCKSCDGAILQGTVGDEAGYMLTLISGSVRNVFSCTKPVFLFTIAAAGAIS
jgi:hypothetical protein